MSGFEGDHFMEVDPVHVVQVPPPAVPAGQAARNREVIEAVKAVNSAKLFGADSELTFVMDRGTQRPVIRIVNRNTNELIRQIPTEQLLRMAEDARGLNR